MSDIDRVSELLSNSCAGVEITVEYAPWRDVRVFSMGITEYISKLFALVLKSLDIFDATTFHPVSVLLTSDVEIAKINTEYRNKPSPTNVLSFQYLEYSDILASLTSNATQNTRDNAEPMGDIALSYDTIAKEAMEQDKTLEQHLSHILVHGLLHLLSYDHQTDQEAEVMETLETEIVTKLSYPPPY